MYFARALRFKKRTCRHDKSRVEKCRCIVTRLSFLPNRAATVGNNTKISGRTLLFSFEQVTRREITRKYYLAVRLAVFTGGAASQPAVASRGSRRDKIINLCVYLVQTFSGKRNNENFNDFLRMLASPSTCRVCAFGVGGEGGGEKNRLEGARRSPERSRLLAKGRLHPFLPLPWKL